MATFLSISTNAFSEVMSRNTRRQRNLSIRRPLRGLEIKEDTHAVIKVIDSMNREVPLINSSAQTDVNGVGMSDHYANFILIGVSEQRAEKQQVVETFGEDFIFFFGEQPRVLNFNAVIVNTADFNWKSEFWENYEQTFRGTRLLEKNARLYIYFDDVVVEGYMLSAQAVAAAENPYHLPLTFSIFVTNYAFLSSVGSVFFPETQAEAVHNTGQEVLENTPGSAPGTTLADPANLTKDMSASSGNSLNAFLSNAAKYQSNGTFSIQATLQNMQNRFFGRTHSTSGGLGNQLHMPTISNNANLPPAPRGEPIHTMKDEYIYGGNYEPNYDEAELRRVNKELSVRDPIELEKEARRQLDAMGISTKKHSVQYLMLGKAAFAGVQVLGTFGMRQCSSEANIAGEAFRSLEGLI